MSQNFLKSPKAAVLAKFPKAICKKEHGYGQYIITLNAETVDFNGRPVTQIKTGTHNPADAWFFACMELRLV